MGAVGVLTHHRELGGAAAVLVFVGDDARVGPGVVVGHVGYEQVTPS